MSAIPASSVSLKTMMDGTLRISFDIEPANAQDAFKLFAAPGTQVAIAALVAGSFLEQKPEVEAQVSVPRVQMGDACYRTVTWCKEPMFWAWINSTTNGFKPVNSAADAKEFVCSTCGIESRKELDANPAAYQLWNFWIREPYRRYLREAI